MIFSIHRQAHKALTESFRSRGVSKVYQALAAGHLKPGEGEFRSLLARGRATNRMKSVARGGREAVTRYRVLEEFSGASLVEVDIPTGRSHQIRVHFSEAGHPLLGDSKYGGNHFLARSQCQRTMLHAFRLVLNHPAKDQRLSLEAPLAEDMTKVIRALDEKGKMSLPGG